MTTRLDRLLLLLSTGSTPLVRQTAARQLGSIAGQRIARASSASSLASTSSATLDTYHGLDGEWGEVVNLLVKVLPFLKNKSWETRTAAALAVECIVKAVGVWEPSGVANSSIASSGSSNGNNAKGVLASFDLAAILAANTVLVASSGNEYSGASNGQHAKSDIVKSLGLSMPGAGEAELGIDVEKELMDGASQTSVGHSSHPDVKGKGKVSASTSPAPMPEEDATKNLSARERNALKRKRKNTGSAHASPGPSSAPSKVRIVDSPSIGSATTSNAPSPVAVPLVKKEEEDEQTDNYGLPMSESVTVSYKGPKGGEVDAKAEVQELENTWVPSPDQWPFARFADALQADLLHPAWEIRHGAALGLRELVKVQGRAGGMVAGASPQDNARSHKQWGDSLAGALLVVFALDRFGDFLGDQVAAPVRETASQTLSALLLHVPDSSVFDVYSVLAQMIKQDSVQHKIPKEKGRKNYSWEVRHAGLLGTKYLVAVRKDLFQMPCSSVVAKKEEPDPDGSLEDILSPVGLLKSVLQVAILGLRDSDDDVRGVAASALLPITSELVACLSEHDLVELLDVLCLCLGDLKDDLSSSIGNVMDVLSSLIRFPLILSLLQDTSKGRSLTDLVPRLYPFFRHTIPTVRFAVISTLNIFLSLPTSDTQAWIDHRLLRLVYQNLIVEERPDTRLATRASWSTILRHLRDPSLPPAHLRNLTGPHLAAWLDILMTPLGQAVNISFFWKPSEYDPNASGVHDVDKPLLLQDLALVTVEQTLKGRLVATSALAELFSEWSLEQQEGDFGGLLDAYLTSASSHQISFTCYLIEEWTRYMPSSVRFSQIPLLHRLTPRIIAALEGDFPATYSETSALLSQIHTHCQQLFSIFKSKGKVPAAKIPQLVGTSALGFTLARAQIAISSEYKAMDTQVRPQARSTAQPLLEELRMQTQGEIVRMGAIKDSMDVQVFSALAGAAVALKTMPAKMNPLIRSLMNGVKFEINQDLQIRAANAVASFVNICTLPNSIVKANPSDKVVKNLCTFLCQDTTITPIFAAHKNSQQGILNLSGNTSAQGTGSKGKSASKAGLPGVKAEVAEDESVSKARLVRRGAELGLASLSSQFGNALFERVPKLWTCMSDALLEMTRDNSGAKADAQFVSDDARGQDVLDCLTVLSSATPFVPLPLQGEVTKLLPSVVLAIQSDFAVIRYVATRCLAVVCNTITEEGMKSVVQGVIPLIGDPLSAAKRRGAVELVSCLVDLLDIKILPYVIFLIVPVLGRMTDSDDEVRKLATSTFATLVKLVPLEAGLPDPPGFSPELLQQRANEREFLTQLLDGSKVAEYELPISVSVDLRKYQREGISWLAFLAKYQLHGILCDDMGLGKTLQSICILASKTQERAQRFAATQSPDAVHLPSLVVCPPTLTGHWQHEINTYVSNLKATIYGGDRSDRLARVGNLKAFDVVITSYDVVRNDIEALSTVDWNYCILDEGHIIKNAKTKLSAAIKCIRANHRLILSGTPIQNNVLELWSLFDFLMPGFLGTEEAFNRRFGKPIQQSRDAKSSSKDQEAGALALEALHKQVLPFLLRRLKEDVLDDLPPKIIQDYYCDLSPLQQDLYENYSKSGDDTGVNDDKTSSSNGGKETHVFQTLQYLKKLVNHPTLVLQPDNPDHKKILAVHGISQGMGELTKDLAQAPKLLALKQLLIDSGIGLPARPVKNEIDMGEPAVAPHRVLIFCQMKTMLDLIETSLFRDHLPSVTYMRMDGSTPSHKRHSVVQTFNADPSIDVLLLTTHVGGLGLNLTGADTVIFVEHDWNPMKDLQAMDRAHRLGQKRVVNVYRLITRGTLEEKIMGLQRFKMNIASTVVSQQNADMSTMETENVLDLFSLGNKDAEKQGKTDSGPISQKALLEGLGELQDQEREYEDMGGDAGKFAESLKR